MATQSDADKAKRAATKALKQRQQELDDQVLIESTRRKFCSVRLYGNYLQLFYVEEPRQAKAKALETAGRDPSAPFISSKP
jgi:hypothetical protein